MLSAILSRMHGRETCSTWNAALRKGLRTCLSTPSPNAHAPVAGCPASSSIPVRPEGDGDYVPVQTLPTPNPRPQQESQGSPPRDAIHEIPTDHIAPNPYQPRRDFDEAELASLAESVRHQGILQPLVVAAREADLGGVPYVLIAGERRLLARPGPAEVPGCAGASSRAATPQQMLEWGLVENIHRADLNPVERAEAYRSYIDRFGLTQTDAAQRLGQPRTTVVNYLRILELDADARSLIAAGRLSFGHAKVLAGLIADPIRQALLARLAAYEALSVRRLEEIVSEPQAAATRTGAPTGAVVRRPKPAYIQDLESQLSQASGTRVTIRPGRAKNAGRIIIDYYSLDDFERISTALGARLES